MSAFKIVLLGEGRVGKTSCVLRYVNDVFDDKQQSTIMASFLTKRVAVADTRAVLNIWDTAGQERFHSLGPIYYRDADAAVLVYDITDNQTYSQVRKWVKELRKMVGSEIVINIVGNKCDLERARQVDAREAEEYAAAVGANHFLASAKLNRGVDEVFADLARRVIEERAKRGNSRGHRGNKNGPNSAAAVLVGRSGAGGAGRTGRRSTLQVVADDVPERKAGKGGKKGGCC